MVLADVLAGLVVERLRPEGLVVDAVVAVPQHPLRRLGRGFDHAGLVAGKIARRFHLPFSSRALRRTRLTPRQVDLTYAARLAAVRGAFAADPRRVPVGGKLLLVDDVMTTGATASECARVLRRAGAGRVYVAVVARQTRSGTAPPTVGASLNDFA